MDLKLYFAVITPLISVVLFFGIGGYRAHREQIVLMADRLEGKQMGNEKLMERLDRLFESITRDEIERRFDELEKKLMSLSVRLDKIENEISDLVKTRAHDDAPANYGNVEKEISKVIKGMSKAIKDMPAPTDLPRSPGAEVSPVEPLVIEPDSDEFGTEIPKPKGE